MRVGLIASRVPGLALLWENFSFEAKRREIRAAESGMGDNLCVNSAVIPI
jgi:hypothetical protein